MTEAAQNNVKPRLRGDLDINLGLPFSEEERCRFDVAGTNRGNRLSRTFVAAAAGSAVGSIFMPALMPIALCGEALALAGGFATASLNFVSGNLEFGQKKAFLVTATGVKKHIDNLAKNYDLNPYNLGSIENLKDSVDQYGANLRATYANAATDVKVKGVILGTSVLAGCATALLAPAFIPVVALAGMLAFNAEQVRSQTNNIRTSEEAEKIMSPFRKAPKVG